MIRILLVDDDPLIRESLRLLLGHMEQFEIAGSASGGYEALAVLQRLEEEGQPADVVLLDIRMPEGDGVECTKRIRERWPHVKVLILTTFDEDEYIVEALKNGAGGYMLKNTSPERIAEGIRTVHQGSMLIHPDVAKKVSTFFAPQSPSSSSNPDAVLVEYGLTKAERAIVHKIAEGLSNREIAQELFLSEGTVKNYLTEILSKLSLRDRTQVAIFYLKLKS
ncbi:response regulator transcription factor [Paenibacillus turpanensis]|uniref:response regulator transcription factor n=1 Tax=Paenibacillus turpanensis TaxID=2689078 RepID=UPI001407EF15|nr:response regulator transcription factor [Paenibacillus turpanensis]